MPTPARVRPPFIVNYGGGVDSTAMLIGLHARGERPDLVIFADTGGEKPETYAFVREFSTWLEQHGFPPVTWVRRPKSRPSKTGPGYTTLEGNCLQNATLPSLAFGRKSCSLKWKAEPIDMHLRELPDVRAAWARGEKPIKAIGYDAGPADARRGSGRDECSRFRYRYPLREWGWDREHCEAVIRAAGLAVPLKSACFFCPASKPAELVWLSENHPELLARAIAMEDNARPYLTKIAGLWRRATKTRPGSWREFAESCGLLRESA